MPWVVTRLCRDCKDTACAEVCPVDCFYEPESPSSELPDMLYISPEECIDCAACEAACPWEAIFQDSEVPPVFAEDTPLNLRCDSDRNLFKKAEKVEKPHPAPEQVKANKAKWGYSG